MSAYNLGELGLIPELGRFPGEGKSYPFQDFSLENSTDCVVHGVAVSTGALYFLVWLQVTVQYSLFQPGVLPLTFLIGLLTVSFLRFHPSESVIISSSFLKREGCPRW